MKNKAIITAILISTLLTGCQGNDSDNLPLTDTGNSDIVSSEEETQAPETDTEDQTQLNFEEQTYESQEAYIHFDIDYSLINNDTPSIIKDNINESILKIVNANKSLYTAQYGNLYSTLSEAEKETFVPYTMTISGQVLFVDDRHLSYQITSSIVKTPEAGITEYYADDTDYLNFDIQTGQALTLFDLTTEDAFITKLKATYPGTYDAVTQIDDLSAYNSGDWYFDTQNYKKMFYFNSPETLQYTHIGINLELDVKNDDTTHMIGTSIKSITDTEVTDDYELSLAYPTFLNEAKPYAETNTAISESLENFKKEGVTMATRDHEDASDADGYYLRPYQFTSDFSVYTNTEKMLSLGVSFYQYTGGAHGMSWYQFYNVNIATGEVVELSDLFEEGFDYETYINDTIRNEIAAKSTDDTSMYSYFSFEGIFDTQKFYIENNQLVIYFDPYDIAPYAAGAPTFVIPLHMN